MAPAMECTVPSPVDWQEEFARALVDPGQPVPGSLRGSAAGPSRRRFNVYRNNRAAGLVDALRATFLAVERLVGEEFFQAAARAYIDALNGLSVTGSRQHPQAGVAV